MATLLPHLGGPLQGAWELQQVVGETKHCHESQSAFWYCLRLLNWAVTGSRLMLAAASAQSGPAGTQRGPRTIQTIMIVTYTVTAVTLQR